MSVWPAETNGNSVTSWIPLTTSSATPTGCANSFRLEGYRLVAYDPAYGIDVDPTVKCMPPAVTTWWNQGNLGSGNTAVSLGPLTCPSDFSTVATSIKDTSTTAVMCCPPGYTLNGGVIGSITGDCISNVLAGATLTYASTPATNSHAWIITTTYVSSRSTVGAIGIVGYNVNRAVSSTIASGTSSSSSPSASSSLSSSSIPAAATSFPTSSAPSSTTSTTQSTSSSITSAGGLSTGAKAGIGVGAALGAIGVIALIAAIVLLRRRNKPSAGVAADEKSAPRYNNPNDRIYNQAQQHQELENNFVQQKPAELDSNTYHR